MKQSLRIKGDLLSLDKPIVMGILNLTPDSFYSGSKVSDSAVIDKAGSMLEEGATILDLGGQSTRPGAEELSAVEEAKRVIPAIANIAMEYPNAVLSVDTFYADVARAAVEAGASIVNDISGGSLDDSMFETLAELQVPYILMHIKGRPRTMQRSPQYDDVVLAIFDYFKTRIDTLHRIGLNDIILDPGFGFGKTISHNYEILRRMKELEALGSPILAGISRKSMIWKVLNSSSNDALNGTTFLHAFALQNGARILRVHDVAEAVEAIQLFERYSNSPSY